MEPTKCWTFPRRRRTEDYAIYVDWNRYEGLHHTRKNGLVSSRYEFGSNRLTVSEEVRAEMRFGPTCTLRCRLMRGLNYKDCGGPKRSCSQTTTGMKMESEKIDYAAWIGLDWGSQKHAICLQPADSGTVERYTLEQKPEALRVS